MVKLPIPWPPVCHACGQPILSYDTAVVVVSDDNTLPEIERARHAAHGFCLSEAPAHAIDLREFAELVRKADRRERSE